MKNLKTLILGIVICTSIGACNNSNREAKTQDIVTEATQLLCFKNEYPFKDNPEIKDIQELMLTIENGSVSGSYNWLPAEKDERKGFLKGEIKGNVIQAEYAFYQEGISDSTTITITLEKDIAIIKGGNEVLGLDASIKAVNCDEH